MKPKTKKKPAKKTLWVNVYERTDGVTCEGVPHRSRTAADRAANSATAHYIPCRTRIACVRVTYRKGEGL